MINRARFPSKEEQRIFFILNKKRLNLGGRKLAVALNSSRGTIESFSSGRTAPPIDIVKRLESMTGIKAEFESTRNRVVRKRRNLMPMSIDEAERVLRQAFKNDYDYVKELIRQPVRIKDVASLMRKQYNHRFDGSVVQRAIGACRKYLQIRIVKEIEIPKDSVVVKGCTRVTKNSFTLFFSLKPLAQAIKEKKIKVGLEISEDKKSIRLFPLERIGRNIGLSKQTLRVVLPQVLNLEPWHKVNVIYSPREFGQNYIDFIQDKDGRSLAAIAENLGFEAYPIRNTNNTNSGDLTLRCRDCLIMIEVTRAISPNVARLKIGQCLVQKIANKDISFQFIICRNNMFSQEELNALGFIGVGVIYTDFKENWPKDVLSKIKEKVNSNEISNL